MQKRVVVTGMGVISPLGGTLSESWKNVISGVCGITKLVGPDYDKLPCRVAAYIQSKGSRIELRDYFTKTELKSMGSSTAYALLATREALEDAKLLKIDNETKQRTGVAVGTGMVDLQDICETNDALNKGYRNVSPFFVPRILPNMSAGQISIKYGFQGPNHSVSTACATGAHAIGDSYRFIRNGDADIMICGATEACISPLSIAAFCRLRALSTSFNDNPDKASRPFDNKRDGFVMGEGTSILVLEHLEHALKRGANIYAEILGYGLSGDASHLTAPSSDGTGAFLAMQRAVKDANISLDEITYINAHATSTPMGDSIELKAIRRLFENNVKHLSVSSTKGAHGHLLGAAGNLETTFTIKAVEEGLIPPTINLDDCEDNEINFVRHKCQEWKHKRRVALKNAFGFGGTNACLCIGQYN